jgi:hypothetical protein
MKATKIVNLVVAAGLMASGSAFAASQGTVGLTSQGESVITIVIPDLIRIDGLADIDLGSYDGDGLDRTGSSPACVRTNGASTYGIVVTSANGAFQLDPTGGASTNIPYSLTWGGAAVTYNTNLASQSADSTTLLNCAPVADQLEVTVTGANLDAAEADSYEDTVILTVTPD